MVHLYNRSACRWNYTKTKTRIALRYVCVQDTLAVMTDRLHKSGFKMHATLLRHMFQLVEAGHVTVDLYDPAQHPGITVSCLFCVLGAAWRRGGRGMARYRSQAIDEMKGKLVRT